MDIPIAARALALLGILLLLGPCLFAQQEQKKIEPRLDLNKATAQELQKLPEIGPKLAKAIVQFRQKSGPFRRVEDLLAVPGISKRRLEKIRPLVCVDCSGEPKSGSQQVRKSGREEVTTRIHLQPSSPKVALHQPQRDGRQHRERLHRQESFEKEIPEGRSTAQPQQLRK